MEKYLNNDFHFPTKWQAVIFRNYGLVENNIIAQVLSCKESDIVRHACVMGLGRVKFEKKWRKDGYLTIIRANWHLLPHAQLLQLMNMTEKQFEKIWYEDDFLFVKLGESAADESVKFSELTDSQLERTKRICLIVDKYFVKDTVDYFEFENEAKTYSSNVEIVYAECNELREYVNFVSKYYDLSFLGSRKIILKVDSESSDENFFLDAGHETIEIIGGKSGLLRGLQYIAENKVTSGQKRIMPIFKNRLIYSYAVPCLDFLSETNFPSDDMLIELAKKQINGIFMHTLLRALAPFPFDPTYSDGYKKRLENLGRFIRRVGRYGIKLYLYLNEPRGLSLNFFEGENKIYKGSEANGLGALCLSEKKVKQWINDSISMVADALPDEFGGFITITMSENLTHCKSIPSINKHCERCKDITAYELGAEVNNLIYTALQKSNARAKLFAWMWGYTESDALKAIELLSPGIVVMNVSEDAQKVNIADVENIVIDYSMAQIGPSGKSKRIFDLAKKTGHERMAKLQVNNTWECSSAPYLPAFGLVEKNVADAAKYSENVLLSWTLGGYPSINIDLVKDMCFPPDVGFYDKYFPESANSVKAAAAKFDEAFLEFPFNLSLLYTGPQNYGCSDLFFINKTGMSATMIGYPYDDLMQWRGNYPVKVFLSQLKKLSELWGDGVTLLEEHMGNSDLYTVATAHYIQFRSAYLQALFVAERDKGEKLTYIIDEESELTAKMLTIQARDKRIGFEASNHYYFYKNMLLEKMVQLDFIKDRI